MNSQEEPDFEEYPESERKGDADSEDQPFAPSYPIRVNVVITKVHHPSQSRNDRS